MSLRLLLPRLLPHRPRGLLLPRAAHRVRRASVGSTESPVRRAGQVKSSAMSVDYGSSRGGSSRLHGGTAARLLAGGAEEWEGPIGVARSGKQARDQYVRLGNGALTVYAGRTDPKPLKQLFVRDIKSIRWSGVEVSTPLETFRLYPSHTSMGQDPQLTHNLFTALDEYVASRREEPEFVNHYQGEEGLSGCMQVGALGDGRVLYRPFEGHDPAELDNDVLRLSIAIHLVREEELKKKLEFSGWVQKSSKFRDTNKQRYLKVERAQLQFFDDAKSTSGRPRKMFGVDQINMLRLCQLTVDVGYDQPLELCSTKQDPSALQRLVAKLDATYSLLRGDIVDNFEGAFDALDRDGDGRLSRAELQRAGMAETEVAALYAGVDQDGDGTISRAEFVVRTPLRLRASNAS